MTANIATDSITCTIHLGSDYVAAVKRFKINLDEGRAPYGETEITIILPTQSTADQIDPRSHLRATIVYTKTQIEPAGAPVSRTFDLYLQKRVKDPQAGEMTLTFRTDEAKLIDDMLGGTVTDPSAESLGASLRAVINNALSGYSAALMANLAPNPGVETDTTGWTVVSSGTGNTYTLTRLSSASSHGGKYMLNLACSGTNSTEGEVRIGGVFNVTAGQVISVSAWVKSSAVSSVKLAFRLFTLASGGGSETASATVSGVFATGTSWSRVTWSYTVLAGTLSMSASIRQPVGATAAGRTINVDDVTVVVGSVAEDFPDADFTPTYAATNLARNPRFANATTVNLDWTTGGTGGARTLTYPTVGGPLAVCPTFSRATITSPITDYLTTYDRTQVSVQPGHTYAVTAWVRSSVSVVGGLSGLKVLLKNYNGATPTTSVVGLVGALTANVWTGFSFQATLASTDTALEVTLDLVTAAVGTFDVTGLLIVDVTTHSTPGVSYFDGAAASDDYYAYAWNGTAHASTSSRTPLISRDPDMLKRKPGTRMWDFLAPLVQGAGFRLFCDESRVWRLVNPNTYSVAGTITIADAVNITADIETIDLGEADTDPNNAYAEAIVVHYSWISPSTGLPTDYYDSAGASHGVGYKVEIEGPYPGPGAAANIYARANGRGRSPELSALSDLTATPGMTLVAAQPVSTSLTGVLSSVEWTDSDEMAVTGRNFV